MFVLTSPWLLCASIGLWLAAIIGCVWLWPRMASSGIARLTGRTGIILIINLLLLVATFLAMNDKFGFYDSWTDLGSDLRAGAGLSAGTNPPNITVGADAATVLRMRLAPMPALTPANTPTARELPTGDRQDGADTYQVSGPSSGLTDEVIVVLPPDYSAGTRTYPVIYGLHGVPGTPASMLEALQLPETVNSEVAAGKLNEAVEVFPNTAGPNGADIECADTNATKMETFLAVDLPAWIRSRFRVSGDRSGWATLGVSEGGFCASMLAMRHPNQFGTAISFAGYFRGGWGSAKAPDGVIPADYNLVRLAHSSDAPPVALWVMTTRTELLNNRSVTQFLTKIDPPLSVREVVLRAGGHRFSIWQRLSGPALEWLASVATPFGPVR